MSIWKGSFSLEEIQQSRMGTMAEHLEIEITGITDDTLSGSMPVDHKTMQPMRIMHGGASCVLAETLGSVAASLCIDQATHVCVGIEINTSHLRMAREGFVFGVARPIHLGATTQLWNIDITDKNQRLISTSRLRLAVLPKTQSPMKN